MLLRTLRRSIDWSYDRCTTDERALWARMSVFASGMDLDSVTAVCGEAAQEESAWLVEVVLSLVNKSVITTKTVGSQTRYQMLEVIRDYGREKLAQSGQLTQFQSRHSAYFLELVERTESEWASPGQAASIARLRRVACHGDGTTGLPRAWDRLGLGSRAVW
jgi:predicted ATPase